VVADALSRVETIQRAIDLEVLAQEQQTDEELQELLKDTDKIKHTHMQIPGSMQKILCDSTPIPRPYVPANMRRQAFQSLHGMAHPGIKASIKLVGQRFVWPGMQRDCMQWARACIPCQKAKVTRHNITPTEAFIHPTQRFQHVHTDIVGLLPTSEDYRYCLTMVDRFMRWTEVISISDITAETIAKNIFSGWIARIGTPARITTDQGRQFEAELFRSLTKFTGTKHIRTTAYHPEANGMVERLHRQLKAAIKAHQTEAWTKVLPIILLGIRATWKEDIKSTPAEMVYGEPIRLPGQFLDDQRPQE